MALLRHFVDPSLSAVRASRAVEVKWGIHPAGNTRAVWTSDDQRTTLALLISGRFRLDLTVSSTTLARQGDYVVCGPGIDHSWQAEKDTVVVVQSV